MGEKRFPTQTFVWDNRRWDGFALRDDDIVVSTAPKCGTTWMQTQVALLLFRTPELPAPLATLSPWIDMNTRPLAEVHAALDAQTHRRFIKTHTPLDALPWHDTITYLHVARDPRDAALSWDDHRVNMDFDRLLEVRIAAVGMDDFEELGIDAEAERPPPPETPEARFWDWLDGDPDRPTMSMGQSLLHHSQTFWDARDRPNVHLFHYAEQQADLPGQMTRLAAILGVDPPTEELIAAARFEEMRAQADRLVPNSDTPVWFDTEAFFRKARAGEGRALIADELPRYAAAVRATLHDEDLITWLHQGPLDPS